MAQIGFKRALTKLLPYVKPHKRAFFFSIFFEILSIVLNMTVPIITGYAIDCMVGAHNVNFHLLFIYIGVIAVLVGFGVLCDWLGNFNMEILSYRTAQSLRTSIYKKLNNMPIKYVDNNSHGEVMNTMIADVENITDGFLEGFKAIVCGIFQIIVVGIMMFVLNVPLAIIVVVFAPISLLCAILITRRSKLQYKQKVNFQGELSGYAEEMLTNMKIVKAFCSEHNTVTNFAKLNKDLGVSSEKSRFYASLANPTSRFINKLINAAIAVVGAFMAIAGKIKIGRISSFLSYSSNFTSPINDITDIFADLNVAVASANRVFGLLNEENLSSDRNLPELKACNGEVSLKNVEFSYEKSFKLITNLNLEVKPGQRIAIVGPTGCGKSTIINLLMRFYDVDAGAIKVSGKDIRKVKRNSFRRFYGMVLQESWLYNASVKDNVAYGKPNASMDEIVAACKLANAHNFIKKLPNGYDTIITERADNISAGQKQLLCIARVMLLHPPMLILDEATSNIDTRTEQKIQQSLDLMMKGRTCFIVAHRLSTIVNADTILVMNHGNIIEQGKHQQLLEQKGFYYNLFNSQFKN